MTGAEFTETIVCALRPEGSWIHMLTLAGFVFAAWSVRAGDGAMPSRRAPRVR